MPIFKTRPLLGRYALVGGFAALAAVLDQASKAAVVLCIPPHTEIPVISGLFSLVHVRNRGAAFGFLNRHDISWQVWLFLAATVAALAVILYLTKKCREDEKLFFIALGLIAGGAVGNCIDRLLYREVIDFLDFYLGSHHWPAFNAADIAICCGAGLALLLSLRSDGRKHKQQAKL